MSKIFEKIINLLNKNNVEYKLTEHDVVKTSEEAAAIRGVELKTGAKAMLVKYTLPSSSLPLHALFVLPAHKKVDWRKVKNILEVKDASLTPREEAEEVTGLTMGCVPPFGSLMGFKTYLDKELLENEKINFSAAKLTHSLQIKPEDLVTIEKPEVCEFTKDE